MMLPHVSARLFNTPLMIDAGKASAVMAGLGGRVIGTTVHMAGVEPVHHQAFASGRPSMGVIDDRVGQSYDRSRRKTYAMVGNVAVIAVEGTLVHKGAFLEQSSGETSYQGLQTQVQRAMRDPAVNGVVFEVDSYGGEVAGAFATADMIFALSQTKPTIAILSDHALSAAYLMASAARQIIVPETGAAGSIGVIAMHVDYSRALDGQGVDVTLISSGAHKADGTPYKPLSEDVLQRFQASVDGARRVFAEHVSRYRGRRLSFTAAMNTEALVYEGQSAVQEGLADAWAHPVEAFQAFLSEINRA